MSVIAVVAIVMILIYSLMDRIEIFKADTLYSKQAHNAKEVYKYRKWEEYGYLDYVPMPIISMSGLLFPTAIPIR